MLMAWGKYSIFWYLDPLEKSNIKPTTDVSPAVPILHSSANMRDFAALEVPLQVSTKRLFEPYLCLLLGLQIAQGRSYLYTLGPKVGIIYIRGALGLA